MKYAGIIKNDIAAGEGVNVSFFTQGCPFHCEGCHNPETWSFDGGKDFSESTLEEIIKSLRANGVQRNLSIMGGEPLCDENLFLTLLICSTVKKEYPDIKIYIWSGYTFEELKERNIFNPKIFQILSLCDTLIDGRFILSKRDITLEKRGSTNQRIINLKELQLC